jgi:hypothetical protein
MFIDYKTAKDANRACMEITDFLTIQFPTRDVKPFALIKNSGSTDLRSERNSRARTIASSKTTQEACAHDFCAISLIPEHAATWPIMRFVF